MKKALRFLTLAAILCIPWVTQAQTVVEIGDETRLDKRAPITTEYNYSISEMLYTADEIGISGTITSIAFNYANAAAKNFSIHVYMKQVTEENLWDGISFADATLVFEGMYSVTGPGWFPINLETPFAYDGSSNLLIGVIKDEPYGFSGDTWTCTWGSGMTRYDYSGSTPFTSTSVPSHTWIYRPNIQLTFTGPTCGRPTALTVSNVTTNGASFAWESTVGNYTFEYKTEADDDWTVVTGLTSNTYTLNTLASGTAYQVRVKNVCGVGLESPYETTSFTTLYSFPLVEDFGTSAPDLWPQYEGLVDEVIAGTATLSAQGGWSFGINAGVNSKHAYSSFWGQVDKWLVTPALTIGNNVQLTFDVALTGHTSGDPDTPPAPQTTGTDDRFLVLVGVMEGDAVSSWTILREWNNAIDATYVLNDIPCTATGMEVALDLSAYAGETVCIAFYVESTETNAFNTLHIDNVSIDYIPTCVRPATLEASNVATTSATLTWTGGSGTYNVQYKTACDDEWTTLATNTTSLSSSMTGLTPGTRYQVRVQSVCGGETSIWMTTDFATNCVTVTSFPWTEDFECYSAVYFDGVCWVNEHISGEGSELFRLETYATGSNNTKHLRMPARGEGNMTKLRLPQMTLPNDNYTFSIDVYRYFASYNPNTDNYTMEGIRVFVSTDGEIDGATELAFIPRAYHVSRSTIPAEAEEGWYTYEIPIGISGTCYIILRVDDQDIGSNYMDNFIVMETPTCRRPTNLAVTGGSVTGHEATITWTAGEGGQDAWVVAYKKASDENFTEVNVSDNPTYTFTNLDPLTEYNVKVRANCGGTPSRWEPNISTVDFTTDIACTPPRGLAATLTPGNGSVATLSWVSTASNFVLAYGTSADFTDATLVNVGATSKDLTGLTPEATYYARVKAVCGGDGESSWSSICTFTPTNAYSITVNDGDATDVVPVYGYYVNQKSYSQFIIPAASLAAMQWASIDQLVFYSNMPIVPWTGAEFEVYMTEVNYTTFSSNTLVNWSEMDKVMTAAHLEISDNQLVVTLTDPYQYLGGNLMIGIKETTSASTSGSASFLGVEATGASLGGHDNSISQQDFLPKTTFYFTPGVAPSCVRPTCLTVSYTGGTTATVSWASTASAWNLKLNGTPVAGTITNPYTLTGLNLATDYSVEVQADCGSDDTSQWTNPVSFSTELCLAADRCELTFELTDSYGDSWNGNAIRVTDVLTGEIIGEMTNENLNGTSASGEDELNVKTLAVCDGREIQFSWVSGSFDSECSYVVKDINGEEIFSGSGAMASPASHTVSCVVTDCRIPSGLTVANITNHTAQLSWTERGEATAWKVAYKTGSGDFTEVDAPTNPFTLTGLDPETDYTVKVRPVCDDAVIKWSATEDFTTDVDCPAPTGLTVTPTPTSAQVAWTSAAGTYNLRYREYAGMATITLTADDVWGNGTGYQMLLDANADAYGTLIPTSSNYLADDDVDDAVYNQFEYKIPVDADGSLSTTHIVTDGNSVTIQIPAGVYDWCITNPAPGNKMWFAGDHGNVAGRVDDYEFEAGKSYEFSVYFNGSNDAVNLTVTDVAAVETWTVVNGITDNPYTLEGLTPSTTYQVQVQADCGSDGESEWSAAEEFTTLEACPNPTALTITPTTSSAQVAWNGFASSYTLQYSEITPYWLQYDNSEYSRFAGDGDPSTQWTWGVMYPAAMLNGLTALTKIAVFENYVSDYTVNIYSGGDVEPGTLIGTETVTPMRAMGVHEVLLSSPLTIDPAQNLWVTLTITGEQFPMAMCEENDTNNQWIYWGDSWRIMGDVDNSFAPYGWMIRACLGAPSSWTTVNDATSPATINSLNTATDYIVRVKGDCGSDGESGWSYGMFTTLYGFSKDIAANTWYVLSSPVHNSGTYETFAGVTNLTSGTYDLLYWDQYNGTWVTSKPAVFTTFERGQGYIYRRSDATTLSFLGERNSGNFSSNFLDSRCSDANLKGFNLMGNPYPKAYTPTDDYYKLNTNGTWTPYTAGDGSVAVAEGFFVKVATGGYFYFTEPSGAKGAGSVEATTLAFTVSNDEFTDIAYARFGAGEGLPKFAHLNPAAPALSIPQEDRHYAIANLSESVESFPLAFSGTGEYTLTVDNTSAYGYLHLIDHATGADVDLLRTASYTFQAAGSDADRFLVKLSPDNNEGTFVRISGDRIIVDGTGELEVYDVMGRQLGSAQVNGTTTLDRSSLGIVSTGVYVLRLNGESQKIVVK